MSTMEVQTLIQSILTLLSEAYDGPASADGGTWFIDNKPDSGIFALIEGITAAEASTTIDGSWDRGTTIASNVEHLRWSLANANQTMSGGAYNTDWYHSWDLLAVDQSAWEQLCQNLWKEYNQLKELLATQTNLQGEMLNGVLGLVPHAAYHLGIMRSMHERIHRK